MPGRQGAQADGGLCALWSQGADSGPDSATCTVRVPCGLRLVPSLPLLQVPNPRILHSVLVRIRRWRRCVRIMLKSLFLSLAQGGLMAPGECPKELQQPAFSMLDAPHPTPNTGSRKCCFFFNTIF